MHEKLFHSRLSCGTLPAFSGKGLELLSEVGGHELVEFPALFVIST